MVIRADGSTVQAASNAPCLSVGSVDCTTVLAVPARVTADSRDMWVLIVTQVSRFFGFEGGVKNVDSVLAFLGFRAGGVWHQGPLCGLAGIRGVWLRPAGVS